MQAEATIPMRPADEQWGYPFGVDGLVTITQAAEFLQVHRTTIYRLRNDGKLRHGRYQGSARICRRSLLMFANSVES